MTNAAQQPPAQGTGFAGIRARKAETTFDFGEEEAPTDIYGNPIQNGGNSIIMGTARGSASLAAAAAAAAATAAAAAAAAAAATATATTTTTTATVAATTATAAAAAAAAATVAATTATTATTAAAAAAAAAAAYSNSAAADLAAQPMNGFQAAHEHLDAMKRQLSGGAATRGDGERAGEAGGANRPAR